MAPCQFTVWLPPGPAEHFNHVPPRNARLRFEQDPSVEFGLKQVIPQQESDTAHNMPSSWTLSVSNPSAYGAARRIPRMRTTERTNFASR